VALAANRPRLARLAEPPGSSYFVGSAVFHYLGPAFAVLLFARVPPTGVAWLRIATAAAVYAAWRRPWRSLGRAGRPARRTVVAGGVVIGAMYPVFYLAIDRLARQPARATRARGRAAGRAMSG
jgi:inner membrane transporter RhtA